MDHIEDISDGDDSQKPMKMSFAFADYTVFNQDLSIIFAKKVANLKDWLKNKQLPLFP